MLFALPLLAIGAPLYPPVDVQGNIALPEALYRTVLSKTSTRAVLTPSIVEDSIAEFLHASGYEIATVTATLTGQRIKVVVDEGRLDRIIFLDESAANAIQLQLAIALPGRIFNRPLLEKKLGNLIAETDVIDADYQVVPTKQVEHQGVQVEDPGLIHGITFFQPGEPHELRVRLVHSGWTRGFDIGLGFKPPDGLFVKAGYKYGSLIFDRDIIQLKSRVATRVIDAFTTANARFGLSDATATIQWFTPPLKVLRIFAELEARALGARREDLGLQSYLFSPLGGSLNFQVDLFGYVRLELGIGAEQRFLYALHNEPGIERAAVVDETNRSQARMVGDAVLEAIFNPKELRRDRKHRLLIEARHRSGGTEEGKPYTELTLEYEKMFLFGWDELWIGFTGASLFGEVPFFDEVPLGGDFMHGTFSQVYVKQAAAVHLEYRLSLSRDFFKIGFYNDFVTYGALDIARDNDKLAFADTLGFSMHVMVLDTFQLTGFIGVGLNSDKDFDVGIGVAAQQAF